MRLRLKESLRGTSSWLTGLVPSHANDTTRGLFLAIAVGIISGLGAVLFRDLIWLIDRVAFEGGARAFSFLGPYYIILIPALGGAIVGPLVYWFAREAKGHGVPEVMMAVIRRGGRIRPAVAVIKILASAVCIGTGGSVGREGPIVQIGSTFGSALGQRLRLPQDWIKNLVACGAAGGISATFNAPIAGVFFALEVILGRFTTRYFSLVVFSSVVAAVVSHAFFPDVAALDVPQYELESPLELPLYAILGILAAFLGVAFILVLYRFESAFDRLTLIPEPIKPIIGGFGVGMMGLYSMDLLGVGYGAVEKAATGELIATDAPLLWGINGALVLMGLKIVATSLTIGSGGSGGVFAPSLFIGAMLGTAFGAVANEIFPEVTGRVGAYALVGMAAVFSASARAPITATIILFELTNDYKIILPLMLAVVVSTVLAQTLHRESIYTKKLRRSGIEPPDEEEPADVMRNIRVEDVMTTQYPTVAASTPVTTLWEMFEHSQHRGFPVLNTDNELCGLVTVGDVETAYRYGKQDATAGEIATDSVVTAYPDQSVHEALWALGAKEVGRIPVVDRENPKRLVGVLRRHDIIRAYTRGIQGHAAQPGSSP